MKIIKKFFIILSAGAVLSVNFSAVPSWADTSSDNFEYTISDGAVSINGCNSENKEIIIPDTIENLPVTSVNQNSFKECISVESVYIGDYVEFIADGAFSGCTSLKKIEVSAENEYFSSISGSLYTKNGETLVRYAGETSGAAIAEGTKNIGNTAFFGEDIVSVSFPDSLVSIGNYSFAGCMSLKSVNIPDTVTSLGTGSFMNCTKLDTIRTGKGLKEIPENCFALCTELKNVFIAENITSLGTEAFYGCSALNELYIPKTVEKIGENAAGTYYDIRTDSVKPFYGFILYGFSDTISETYAAENQLDFTDVSKVAMGDITGDGTVDAMDASLTLAEYTNVSSGVSPSFSKIQFIAADYNNDGIIDSIDASLILAHYVEISSGN